MDIIRILIITLMVASCNIAGRTSETPGARKVLTDEELLDLVQERTFQYFWDGAEKNSGMALERYHEDGVYVREDDEEIVTTGGSGFGIMAIIAGIEREYVTRSEGVDRLEQIVNFLREADRFHGVWPHWLNGKTGKVRPFSARDDGADIVETSLLIQGLLTARQYLMKGNDREQNIAATIDTMWREVQWDWHTKGENVLYWHWSPNHEWAMNHQIRGYNESLITYVLAASSPTFSILPEVYHKGWARDGEMKDTTTKHGYTLTMRHNRGGEYGGPLFWAHYSYLGLDPRNLVDRYANYWEHNVNHTLLNRAFCIENPNGFKGYGENSWGLTSSYSVRGYTAHSPQNDRGVITPTAALSSIPYTPEYSLQAMRYFYEELGDRLFGKYGFYDAFSETEDWFLPRYLAIDQGPIVVMIENHRTGLLWDLFMSSPEISEGLEKLGFTSY
jgi:hypothetical protein